MTTADKNINSEALLDNRSLRDRYADQVEALERVGKLTMLPDDLHVTKEMVANFYGVVLKSIESVVFNHKGELVADGVKVIKGEELSFFKNESAIDRRTPALTILPRRAVLRIGMLLRDSEVAKALRSYLLNVEEIAREEAPKISDDAMDKLVKTFDLPTTHIQAVEKWLETLRENEKLKATITAVKEEVKTLAPKAKKYDEFQNSNGYYYIADVSKIINAPGMGPNKLHEFLRDLRVLVKDWEGRIIPTQRYMKSGYFHVVIKDITVFNKFLKERVKKESATTFVTPKGIEFIRNLLIKHGYKTAKQVG